MIEPLGEARNRNALRGLRRLPAAQPTGSAILTVGTVSASGSARRGSVPTTSSIGIAAVLPRVRTNAAMPSTSSRTRRVIPIFLAALMRDVVSEARAARNASCARGGARYIRAMFAFAPTADAPKPEICLLYTSDAADE